MVPGEHSDLEVVPPSENVDQQKYPYYSPEPIATYPQAGNDTHKIAYQAANPRPDQPQTICGLRKRTFWIALILALIVVAAAVGGGVGGALSSKSSNSNKNTSQPQPDTHSSSAPSSSSTPTPTSPQNTTSVTATEIVGPTSTILRDCPSSNNTVYSATFGSSTMQFRKECSIAFTNANGQDNVIGRPVSSLNDCINLCAAYNVDNQTEIEAGTSRICNAVCWRNTFAAINDWPGGMCFGFTTQNVTSDGATVFRYGEPPETRCDSAALMNQEY